MTSLATQMTDTIKRNLSTNAKVKDLQNDIVDQGSYQSGMKTDFGVPISDTDTWLKATNGDHVGPALLEDHIAREKIHRFDHERIPERVVHARGTGVHGHFHVYNSDASKYTYAKVLTDPSRSTPTFVRFSTVQGSRGSADTVRDVRGFATKFYTEEGNWDLVGNNIPVFFIQDAIKFPDFVHAVKPEPHNEVPQAQTAHNNFWDFVSLQPEATHMVMWAMSDRAIPRSYRMMQGFGVNTFTLVNASGERFFVKFHWIPELGVHSFVWDEALKIAGQDPDFHRKDLHEAILSGAPPKYMFGIQVIPEADEHKFDFDILDATKVWPEELVPVQIIGEMVLDRVVDEFFPETEQVAFCTSHVVPGIGFSDDPLLQGRNFSYFDTQISRLGINWEEIPINRPVCPVLNFNRDGAMRHKITRSQVNYWPNRFEQVPPVPKEHGGYVDFAQKVAGIKARVRGPKFAEHYNQAQLFYNSMTPIERQHIVSALAFELDHCDDPVVYNSVIPHLNDVDSDLARQVALLVGAPLPDKPGRSKHDSKSAPLSQFYFNKKLTIKTRRIAFLLADGFDAGMVQSLRAAYTGAGAAVFYIGPRRGKVYAAGQTAGGDEGLNVDHHFEGQRSTMFDAIFIPSGEAHARTLAKTGRAVHWVREAFGHLKAIGAIGEGVEFLRSVVDLPGVELAPTREAEAGDPAVVDSYGVVTARTFDPSSIGDALEIVRESTSFATKFAYEISQHKCYQRELDGLIDKVAF